MNISLLAKWWWKLEHEEGLWQDLVKQKYIKNKCLSQVKHKQSDPPVWTDLLKVRDVYLQGRLVIVRDGKNTDFWNDKWCGNFSLREVYQSI